MECEYNQSLLRKKSSNLEQELPELHAAATTTIEVLSAHLAKPDVANYVLFTHYSEVNRNSVIKLLIRGDLLYVARRDVTKIFKYIIELEHIIQPRGVLWRIMQDNDNGESVLTESRTALVKKTLSLLSKVLAAVTIFQTEHKLFNGEFYFKRKDYRKSLVEWGAVLSGFLRMKGRENPELLINGTLLTEHDKSDAQYAAYQRWYEQSVKITGKLEGPKHFWDTRVHKLDTMVTLRRNTSKKGESHIDNALAHLPPKKETK